MALCKLCLKEKPLRDSHIFPEFLYKPLYDSGHNYLVLKSKTNVGKRPKGIYEKLFCASCEEIIARYEDYAAKILMGDGKTEVQINENKFGFVIKNLDYTRFKLFELSLIWRANIASRPELRRISLGPHSEKIREMLLKEEPGRYYKYGCAIFFLPEQPPELKELIIPPHKLPSMIDGHRGYRAIFNGLFWIFIISSHTEEFEMKKYFLQESGDLPIVNSGHHGWKFILKWTSELAKMKKDI